MKKLAMVAAPDLQENGNLRIKNSSAVLTVARQLSAEFEVTLVLKGYRQNYDLPEAFPAIYDRSVPLAVTESYASYTQKHYFSWKQAESISEEAFDVLLCMDAYFPWCLAASQRIAAKEKLLWLNDTPRRYLLREDILVFREIYRAFDRILFSDQIHGEDFCDLFPSLQRDTCFLPYPLDKSKYQVLAAQPWDNCFSRDEINIVTRVSMDTPDYVQLLPQLAAENKHRTPKLHFYILGQGRYRNHLLRNMVLQDVCDEITLAEDAAQYPMLSACDRVMLLSGQDNTLLVRAARAYGKKTVVPIMAENRFVLPDGFDARPEGDPETLSGNEEVSILEILRK